jgi:hypothetical protein
MKLFKNFMRWTEPRSVRDAYYAYPLVPVWSHFVFAGLILIFILIAFLVRQEDPLTERIMMVGLGVFFGALCGYGIPLIDRLGGANITVGAAGIERMDSAIGNSLPILMFLKFRYHHWEWKDIAFLNLNVETFGGKEINFLEIMGHDNARLGVIGLPVKKFKFEKLLNVVQEYGCHIEDLEKEVYY